jgi:phospholipase C
MVVACLLIPVLPASCTSGGRKHAARPSVGPDGTYVVPPGIHKIRHVINIMQENRSLDSYFGTFA